MIKRVDKRLQAVQCLTGNKIKIIACITMLIDHFSKIFLESIMNDKLFPLYLAGGMSTEQFYGIDAFQKNILNGIGRFDERRIEGHAVHHCNDCSVLLTRLRA